MKTICCVSLKRKALTCFGKSAGTVTKGKERYMGRINLWNMGITKDRRAWASRFIMSGDTQITEASMAWWETFLQLAKYKL